MFDVGPLELVVLALVGIIVLGPERLPTVTKQALQMLRTLREMATGARTQLKNELGPEFSDIDLSALRELRNLNPRTALTRALLADEDRSAGTNPGSWVPTTSAPAAAAPQPVPPPLTVPPTAQRPLERGETAPYDADAT